MTPQNISIHLKNLFSEGEIAEDRTCKEYLQVQKEGNRDVNRKVKIHNLHSAGEVECRDVEIEDGENTKECEKGGEAEGK